MRPEQKQFMGCSIIVGFVILGILALIVHLSPSAPPLKQYDPAPNDKTFNVSANGELGGACNRVKIDGMNCIVCVGDNMNGLTCDWGRK